MGSYHRHINRLSDSRAADILLGERRTNIANNRAAREVAGLELEDEDVREVVTLAVDLDDPAMPTIEVCACSRGGGPCLSHFGAMSERDKAAWRRRLGLVQYRHGGPAAGR
jgi:hypothetical protein